MFKVAILSIYLVSCTQPHRAIKLLNEEGYKNIKITGYRWSGCSQNDSFHTEFEATRNGYEVTGVVCSGILKSQTIRRD